jgi:thiaminase (transcriptional activator TenA)
MARQDVTMSSPDLATHSFCHAVAESTAALQRAISDHPFNQALTDGTLDAERFGFYLVQDSRYLAGFSRALAMASTQAPDGETAAFFALGAHRALMAERSLHDGELRRLGWDGERVASVPTSPTCLAYTSYLAAVAVTDSWPVLVAALLPCFWVYHRVGLEIAAQTAAVSAHPYRPWIDAYSDPEFGAQVSIIRQIADQAAAEATAAIVGRMREAFSRASEYEWMFWDSAWQVEAWPTAAWSPSM